MDNDTVSQVFNIRSERLEWFKDKMAKLGRRASKMGLVAPSFTLGEMFSVLKIDETSGARTYLRYFPATITGSAPKYAGWTIVATIATLEGGEVLLRSISDKPLPLRFRDAGSAKSCDHCKTSRKRLETFVVLSDAGEYKQVGRQCIADFLGHKSPETLAAMAGYVAEAFAFGEGGGSSDAAGSLAIDYYLGYVASAMNAYGWLSRTKAKDVGGNPTANLAHDHAEFSPEFQRSLKRLGEKRLEVTEVDTKRATTAIDWATELTDAEVEANDYLYNVRTIVRAGQVEHKTAGYAASVIIACEKAMDRVRQAAEKPVSNYVGTVKERQLFTVKVERILETQSDFGVSYLHMMTDEVGNDIKWFGSSRLYHPGGEYRMVNEGETLVIKATVKAHQEYKGRKQTLVTRAEAFVDYPKNTKKNQRVAQALVDAFTVFQNNA